MANALPDGIANFDLGQFGKELDRRKIKAQTINLATMPAIPDNSALLVITAPAVPLLAGEIDLIKQYIQQGGNLLLLTDPGNQHLDALQQLLGLRQLPGTIVDSSSKLYGINDPSFVLASEYAAASDHPRFSDHNRLSRYRGVGNRRRNRFSNRSPAQQRATVMDRNRTHGRKNSF